MRSCTDYIIVHHLLTMLSYQLIIPFGKPLSPILLIFSAIFIYYLFVPNEEIFTESSTSWP